MALLIGIAVMTAAQMVICIGMERNLAYPENHAAYAARNVAHGLPAYLDWREWPHLFTPYGPLFYYPAGWLARVMQPPDFGMFYYAAGRAMSLAWYLAACLFASGLLLRLGAPRVVSFGLAFGIPAMWQAIQMHMLSFNPNPAAVALAIAGLVLVLGRHSTRRVLLAALCCVGAVMFKATAVAAPVAIVLSLAREGHRRSGLFFAGVFIAGAAISVASVEVATGGAFLDNVVRGSAMGYVLPPALLRVMIEPGGYSMVLVLGTCVLGGLAGALSGSTAAERAVGTYVLASVILNFALSFKAGADIHYATEPLLLVGPSLWLAWLYASRRAPTLRDARTSLAMGVAVAAVLLPFFDRACRGVPEVRRVVRTVNSTNSLLGYPNALLMDAAFTHSDEKAHAIPDPFHFCLMVHRGKISAKPLLDQLNAGAYDSVAISPVARTCIFEQYPSTGIGSVIDRNYAFRAISGGAEIWTLK